MPTPNGLPTEQDLKDASLDVAHLGRVVNSKDASGAPINTSTNRTGGVNKTLDALEAEYLDAVQAAGGVPLGDGQWAAGVTFTAYNEYLVYNGTPYKPATSTTLPYTTQGSDPTVAPDIGNVVAFSEVQASDLVTVREDLLGPGTQLYMGSDGVSVKVGDTVPAGTTHLRVEIGGDIYTPELTQSISGIVTAISQYVATIGGVNVKLSYGWVLDFDSATQLDIEERLGDSLHNRCQIARLQSISVSELDIPNRSELIGFGEDTKLVLSQSGTALNVKSGDPTTNALSNVTLKDFQIDMGFLTNSVGIDMIYASVQSALLGIRISDVGPNSTGVRLSKEWYARTQRCSIRSTKQLGSVGVLVTTEDGQINDVPIDFQINGVETGVIVDTSNDYVYKLVLPDTFHAERCDVGLRVIPGQGVRQAIIRGYFESNDIADVIWGDDTTVTSDITQSVIWESASFNPVGSKVVLHEGNHIFIGCDRIDTLEVNGLARVEIIGGVVNNIINNTGDSRRVSYRPNASTQLSESKYAAFDARMDKAIFYEGVTTNTSSSFDIVGDSFGDSFPTNGVTATYVATSRRTYDSSVGVRSGIIARNSSGVWGLTEMSTGGSSATSVAIDSSTGVVTISDSRGDTKVYNLKVSPF